MFGLFTKAEAYVAYSKPEGRNPAFGIVRFFRNGSLREYEDSCDTTEPRVSQLPRDALLHSEKTPFCLGVSTSGTNPYHNGVHAADVGQPRAQQKPKVEGSGLRGLKGFIFELGVQESLNILPTKSSVSLTVILVVLFRVRYFRRLSPCIGFACAGSTQNAEGHGNSSV